MFTEEMKPMVGSHVGWRMSMEEEGCRKGPWTADEDVLLHEYVNLHGEGRWNSVSKLTGLKRNGKSCRLRWVNYLRPDLKRGHITPYEESIILELHAKWGNRWSTIARSLPGRTDNEIKNYWRTHFKKKHKRGASHNDEKPKNRSVKQQKQVHLQQQHHHNQQELNQVQTEMMAGWADELEEKTESVSQMEQEMNTLCLHPSEEQQGLFFSAIGYQGLAMAAGYQGLAMAAEASSEDLLWDGGLWNLDY